MLVVSGYQPLGRTPWDTLTCWAIRVASAVLRPLPPVPVVLVAGALFLVSAGMPRTAPAATAATTTTTTTTATGETRRRRLATA